MLGGCCAGVERSFLGSLPACATERIGRQSVQFSTDTWRRSCWPKTTICRFSAQQIDQRLPPWISVDIEIGIDADDAVNTQSCGGFGDGGVGQVQGQAGETLGDAVDGRQAGVGGDVHLHDSAFDSYGVSTLLWSCASEACVHGLTDYCQP